MSIAAEQNIDAYKSFNDFFTRSLHSDVRPIAKEKNIIVSPADGLVSACGAIENNKLLQAKDHHYTVNSLLGGLDTEDDAFASFLTVYLSPKDYHRVHMPFTGKLKSMRYVPGKLFSVNQMTAENIPNLFARNERLVCLFDTAIGVIGVVMVGAMIVAGIETSWHGPIAPVGGRILTWNDEAIKLQKGDELGRFYLGSTVVLLLPSRVALNEDMQSDVNVLMGQGIATKVA